MYMYIYIYIYTYVYTTIYSIRYVCCFWDCLPCSYPLVWLCFQQSNVISQDDKVIVSMFNKSTLTS